MSLHHRLLEDLLSLQAVAFMWALSPKIVLRRGKDKDETIHSFYRCVLNDFSMSTTTLIVGNKKDHILPSDICLPVVETETNALKCRNIIAAQDKDHQRIGKRGGSRYHFGGG